MAKIKRLLNRDMEVMRLAACSGIVLQNNFLDFDVGFKRMQKLEKEHYFERMDTYINGKKEIVYRLGDKGKSLVMDVYGIEPYNQKKNCLEHDYKLLKEIEKLNLNNLTFYTEKDQQRHFGEILQDENTSAVDFLYIDQNGNYQEIEIITEYYTKSMINAKRNFINSINGRY